MTIEKFIDSIAEVFERDPSSITIGDVFRDYDEWDSITLLTLMSVLEDDYGVTIPRNKFEAILTVEELFNYVKDNQ